jgi:outer membrane protein assembly factor BamB
VVVLRRLRLRVANLLHPARAYGKIRRWSRQGLTTVCSGALDMNPSKAVALTLLLLAAPARADNWPAWRGPLATGVCTERDLPTTWSAAQHVRWKVPLPGPGNSTPVVWGDRLFLTQALDDGKRRAVLAFDRRDGTPLWQQEVPCRVDETTHQEHNPPCSGSPATDGTAVYAHFASAGIVAYDLAGKRLWHRDLGPVLHRWGNGSSPVIYKDSLIIYQGPGEPTFLTALNKHTGATVWKKDEPGINSPIFGSWSTPVVVRVGGHDELILPLPGDRIGGAGELKAYDPATGRELWRCAGLGTEVYAMPVVAAGGDLVVGISGHNGPTLAVRPGGRGDVTRSHRVWRTEGKMPQRIGSGVLHDGHLYLADADGFAECLEAGTGKVVWKERLGGRLWGSLLLAGDRLYVSNLEGQTFVLAAGPKFQLLARNDLREPLYAAFAVAHGDLLIRTHRHLYCIAQPK